MKKKKKVHGSFCKVHKNTKLGRKYCAVKAKGAKLKKGKGKAKKVKHKGKAKKRVQRKKGYIWITKFDSKTCAKCKARHGKTYPLSNPPDLLHEYCRCELYLL